MNKKIYSRLVKLTKKALKYNEIAVAAVIVKNDKIISSAYNKRQRKHDVTAHAEILAIKKAEKRIKDWRLDGLDMYVTLKPCKMCEEVINESRISNCFYLIDKPKALNKSKQSTVCYLQTDDAEEIYEMFQNSFKKLR